MAPEIALEQPGIKRLLGQLLERLEKNPARDRAPMQKLDAAHMPEFGPRRRAGEGDAAWTALKALHTAGFISIDPVRSKIGVADYELSPRVRLVVDREDELRQLAGIPRRGPSPQQLWREALARAFGAADPRLERMAACRLPFVEGRRMDELSAQLKTLAAVGEAPGTPLRTISARYFWGLSKLLDGREELLAALLDAGECPFPAMRVHVPVQVSEPFREVLVIENQDTFDLMCGAARTMNPRPVVLCAHGFKASAQRVRTRAGCLPLYVADEAFTREAKEGFERWLFGEEPRDVQVRFWGDLDWEGMRIVAVLREVFPGTQAWRPGYAPMLECLRAGGGHAAAQAGKENQRPIEATGCAYADRELVPALSAMGRFVDQEIVSDREISVPLRSLG